MSPMLVTLALIASAPGCGNATTTYGAQGRVTFADGKPLTTGYITCRLQGAEPAVTARGEIQQDGSFELTTFQKHDGAVAGRYKASLFIPVREGDPVILTVDRRFNEDATSGLEFTVTENPAQNKFEMVVTPPSK